MAKLNAARIRKVSVLVYFPETIRRRKGDMGVCSLVVSAVVAITPYLKSALNPANSKDESICDSRITLPLFL